jgi:hypothetical protein
MTPAERVERVPDNNQIRVGEGESGRASRSDQRAPAARPFRRREASPKRKRLSCRPPVKASYQPVFELSFAGVAGQLQPLVSPQQRQTVRNPHFIFDSAMS